MDSPRHRTWGIFDQIQIQPKIGGLFRLGGVASLLIFVETSAGWADELAPRSEASTDARILFISPADGDIVKSPVTARFALTISDLASIDGNQDAKPCVRLLIDVPLPAEALPILDDEQHRHVDAEHSEMTLDLKPGVHTLQLIAGDADHLPHEPPIISELITIGVSNLEVEKIGGRESKRYRLSVPLEIRTTVDAKLPEEDLEERRRRREERTRLLELLVEDIRRTRRERAEQRRNLTLGVEDATGNEGREIPAPSASE